MSLTVIVVEGIDDSMFSWADESLRTKNISRALNRTATQARTKIDKMVRDQVNFPASYLRPSLGRLVVKQKASPTRLEAVIEGRDRPTSLAQFRAPGTPMPGQRTRGGKLRQSESKAIRVTVKPGRPKMIKGAFIVKLRGAKDAGNYGLAIRTKSGPPSNAYHPTPLKSFGPNVWLLYGPSVNQVLWSVRNNGGVYTQVEASVLEDLEAEFFRLMKLEGGGSNG